MTNNFRTVLCRRGPACVQQGECSFAHSFVELRVRHVGPNFKREACSYETLCHMKEKCPLNHGEMESLPCVRCGVSVLQLHDVKVAKIRRCRAPHKTREDNIRCAAEAQFLADGCSLCRAGQVLDFSCITGGPTRKGFAKTLENHSCVDPKGNCCVERFFDNTALQPAISSRPI